MNKKLTKEQIEKRKQIKNKLMRIVNVICYVCTILLIVVAISTGMQSCKNRKKNNISSLSISTESAQVLKNKRANSGVDYNVYKYSYLSVYDGINNLNNNTITAINNYYNIPNYNGTMSARDTIIKYIDIDAYIYVTGLNGQKQPKHYNLMTIAFTDYFSENVGGIDEYYYRLNYVSFYDGSSWINYMDKKTNEASNYSYGFANGFNLFLSSEVMNDYIFQNFFYVSNVDGMQSFTFVNNINYYYWVNYQNLNKDNPYYSNYVDVISTSAFINQNSYTITINTPYFLSNGNLFNTIELTYLTLQNFDQLENGCPWIMSDGSFANIGITNGYGFFRSMYYYNSDLDLPPKEMVYYRTEASVKTASGVVKQGYTNTCAWRNQAYRQLIFIETIDIHQSYYQNLVNLNSYSSLKTYDGGVEDVFNLLGFAFDSILPILNISIIPGMTIGFLLCLPLAVGMIIILVKLVKK